METRGNEKKYNNNLKKDLWRKNLQPAAGDEMMTMASIVTHSLFVISVDKIRSDM